MKDARVKVKADLTIDEAIAYLGNLIGGLRARELVVSRGAERVTLRPGDRMKFELRVDRENDEEEIALHLRWRPRPAINEPEPRFWLGPASAARDAAGGGPPPARGNLGS